MDVCEQILNWCNSNDGFISAILSFVAAVTAICVPYRIAHKQNKVALFERRFECFQYFESLKNFAKFVDGFDTFDTQESVSPVLSCQIEYLEFHSVLNDRKNRETVLYSHNRITFALYCLNKDRSFFSTMKLLIRVKDNSELEEVFAALKEFVVELFSTEKNPEDIKQKQKHFSDSFNRIAVYRETFEKTLRMYKSCPILERIKTLWRQERWKC